MRAEPLAPPPEPLVEIPPVPEPVLEAPPAPGLEAPTPKRRARKVASAEPKRARKTPTPPESDEADVEAEEPPRRAQSSRSRTPHRAAPIMRDTTAEMSNILAHHLVEVNKQRQLSKQEMYSQLVRGGLVK